MTQTNESIIFQARCELLSRGLLQPTGRTIEFKDETGETIQIPEPEEIHTFQAWKAAGYTVRRGEHAIARLSIWNHTGRKTETITQSDGSEIEAEDKGHFFHKLAYFFAAHQVERVA